MGQGDNARIIGGDVVKSEISTDMAIKDQIDLLSEDENFDWLMDDIMSLTPNSRAGLLVALDTQLSGRKRTKTEQAQDAGMSLPTWSKMERNPAWRRVFTYLVTANVQANIGEAVADLRRNSNAGDTGASRTLLQVAGMLVNVNKNVNYNEERRKSNATVEETVDEMIIRLGELGVHPEAFTNRYIELKNQGRF